MWSEHSCNWLILLFTPLTWNIHIKGKSPNCDSIKDFIKTFLCLMLMKFDNIARTGSFLPPFLQNQGTYSLKFRFLSICKSSSFCLLLSQIFHLEFEPKYVHACNQIATRGMFLGSISYYYSETIQLLVSYHVPFSLSRSLELCHRQKMWYHLQQSYKTQ